MAKINNQDQYIKDKLEEAERLGIKIGPLPLGAVIKDIKITQVNGRYCATVTYKEKPEGEEDSSSPLAPPHYRAKDIFN